MGMLVNTCLSKIVCHHMFVKEFLSTHVCQQVFRFVEHVCQKQCLPNNVCHRCLSKNVCQTMFANNVCQKSVCQKKCVCVCQTCSSKKVFVNKHVFQHCLS